MTLGQAAYEKWCEVVLGRLAKEAPKYIEAIMHPPAWGALPVSCANEWEEIAKAILSTHREGCDHCAKCYSA